MTLVSLLGNRHEECVITAVMYLTLEVLWPPVVMVESGTSVFGMSQQKNGVHNAHVLWWNKVLKYEFMLIFTHESLLCCFTTHVNLTLMGYSLKHCVWKRKLIEIAYKTKIKAIILKLFKSIEMEDFCFPLTKRFMATYTHMLWCKHSFIMCSSVKSQFNNNNIIFNIYYSFRENSMLFKFACFSVPPEYNRNSVCKMCFWCY